MIYIFHGDNQKDSREFLNSSLDKFKDSNVLRLDNKESEPDLVNNFINGTSLFAAKKILVISNFFSIPKTNLDKIIKSIKSNEEIDIFIWQDKTLTATQLKTFPKANVKLFRLDNKLFACLNSIRPHNIKNFVPLFEDVIKLNLYDLFLYLLKNNLRKQLTTYSRFDTELLKKSYLQMIELDYQNKTGELRIAKELALQRIIINLIK